MRSVPPHMFTLGLATFHVRMITVRFASNALRIAILSGSDAHLPLAVVPPSVSVTINTAWISNDTVLNLGTTCSKIKMTFVPTDFSIHDAERRTGCLKMLIMYCVHLHNVSMLPCPCYVLTCRMLNEIKIQLKANIPLLFPSCFATDIS